MTLGFSQEIKGVKNFFPEKIIASLELPEYKKFTLHDFLAEVNEPSEEQFLQGSCNPLFDHKPKIHTIRAGVGRWRAGMDIHMVINNRTSNRFQFAPTIKCKCVQKIEFRWYESTDLQDPALVGCVYNPRENVFCYLAIDGIQLSHNDFSALAINDGFDSVDGFFAYFDKDFTGTLIHWTDLKY